MMKNKDKTKNSKTDAFANVALWQFLAFLLLLCFIWASEYWDIPAKIFGAEPTPFNIFRVSILSAAVITAGIVAVGHTYEQQKSIINNILMTCLYCHRVQTEESVWVHVEEYFVKHYPVAMDRGACPDCQSMLKSVDSTDDKKQKKSKKA